MVSQATVLQRVLPAVLQVPTAASAKVSLNWNRSGASIAVREIPAMAALQFQRAGCARDTALERGTAAREACIVPKKEL